MRHVGKEAEVLNAVGESVLVWGQRNRQALAIIRSLHSAGYFIIFAVSGWPALAAKSRYVQEVWHHPPFEQQPDQFLVALHTLISERGGLWHIYPTDDREIDFLTRHRCDLPTRANLVTPAPAITAACHDKVRMIEIIEKLGIPQAPYHVAHNLPGMATAIEDLGYPCILRPTKPGLRLLGRKAYICGQALDCDPFTNEWPRGHGTLLIQEYVSGRRNDLCFAAESGRILSSFQVCPLRTNMVDGTGLGCDTMTVPLDEDLLRWTRKIVRHFDYTGVGVCQFIVDEHARRSSFLELNPRVGGCTATLGPAVGLNYPSLALELAKGTPVSGNALGFDYEIGIRTSSIHLDISSLLHAYRRKAIDSREAAAWAGQAVTTFVRADTDTTWNWRDPIPGIYGFLMPLLRRGAT